MPRIVFISALFLALAFPAYGQERAINILYTGAIGGELEPCGCSPKTESGGLARLSGFISENRSGLGPYVLIDAGNFLGEDTPQGRLKAEALLKSFRLIGYDAVAFLGNERAFGGFLQKLARKNATPALSPEPDGFRRSIRLRRGPFRVNISADPSASKKGSLNIFLTGRPVSEAVRIKGWDVIITSSGEELESPVRAGDTVIVSGFPRGKKLGALMLAFDRAGRVTEVSHRWHDLGKDIREDERVRGVLKEYDAKVAELLEKEAKRPASEGPYTGVKRCAECHQLFVESWSSTRHSRAFASLEKAGKSRDPECIRCHTAGFGEEGGFTSYLFTPGLANVQCEACHGQGRDHAIDPGAPLKPVTEETCLKCHTRANSPDFDFKAYFEKIKHLQGEP